MSPGGNPCSRKKEKGKRKKEKGKRKKDSPLEVHVVVMVI